MMYFRELILFLAAGLFFIGAAQKKTAPEKLTGGNGKLYIGVFPDRILIIDEATEKITGEIKTRTGVPRRMSLSEDRKRFCVTSADMEHVEVADIASRRVIDSFNLNEGEKKNRIRSLEADPRNRYMIVLVRSSTKLADRFEIGASTLLQYGLSMGV